MSPSGSGSVIRSDAQNLDDLDMSFSPSGGPEMMGHELLQPYLSSIDDAGKNHLLNVNIIPED